MKLLKRITSFLDVERELSKQFGNQISQTFSVSGQHYSILHRLNREPTGWRIVDKDIAEAGFGRISWDTTTITLYSNIGGVTATFEIF
jgi:hypothetical protein